MAQTGSANQSNHGEKSRKSQFSKLSGPFDLKTLTWLSLRSTKYGSVVYSDGTSDVMAGGTDSGSIGLRSADNFVVKPPSKQTAVFFDLKIMKTQLEIPVILD